MDSKPHSSVVFSTFWVRLAAPGPNRLLAFCCAGRATQNRSLGRACPRHFLRECRVFRLCCPGEASTARPHDNREYDGFLCVPHTAIGIFPAFRVVATLLVSPWSCLFCILWFFYTRPHSLVFSFLGTSFVSKGTTYVLHSLFGGKSTESAPF